MILKNNAKYGLFMGVGFCNYTTLMWLTGLDGAYLKFGQYLDAAIIVLPLSIIFFAIHQQNKLSSVTMLERVLIAVTISTVSFVIYDPYLYVYHHFMNPEWSNTVTIWK